MNSITPRIDWYQAGDQVVLAVFIKGLTSQNVRVDFQSQMIVLEAALPNGDAYKKEWNLFGPIEPRKCKTVVTAYKIELTLKKPGPFDWKALESATSTTAKASEEEPSGGTKGKKTSSTL